MHIIKKIADSMFGTNEQPAAPDALPALTLAPRMRLVRDVFPNAARAQLVKDGECLVVIHSVCGPCEGFDLLCAEIADAIGAEHFLGGTPGHLDALTADEKKGIS
jgi:hypothetical protein